MVVVSVALPVYNAGDFLEECFTSISNQVRTSSSTCEQIVIEVSVFNDGSTDESPVIIEKWKKIFCDKPGFLFVGGESKNDTPKGVGYGRNQTIRQSNGEYICFFDADDIMEPTRIVTQLQLAVDNPDAIVGSKFRRLPEGSAKSFTQWANSLSQEQLETQIYLSFGPSIVMPSWFCSRAVYDKIDGGFDETGKGVPEDLIFFYKHLDNGGRVLRADSELLIYRYHPNATTFSVTDQAIWNVRLDRLECNVLRTWPRFSIWNAGKLGRRLYRSLSKSCQAKVSCFCDVDKKKISQKWYHPYPIKTQVPILPVTEAQPPFIICVKTELTWDPNSDFRKLLDSLNLREGSDYFYFN